MCICIFTIFFKCDYVTNSKNIYEKQCFIIIMWIVLQRWFRDCSLRALICNCRLANWLINIHHLFFFIFLAHLELLFEEKILLWCRNKRISPAFWTLQRAGDMDPNPDPCKNFSLLNNNIMIYTIIINLTVKFSLMSRILKVREFTFIFTK